MVRLFSIGRVLAHSGSPFPLCSKVRFHVNQLWSIWTYIEKCLVLENTTLTNITTCSQTKLVSQLSSSCLLILPWNHLVYCHSDCRMTIVKFLWSIILSMACCSLSLFHSSTAVGLYGALLRLQQWHNAHIEMIIPSSSPALQSSPWPFLEWRQALGRLSVCGVREWRPATSIIWRGDIHVTENKVCVQSHN